MYTNVDLIKHPYFKDMLQQTNISYLLDPLTGVVTRQVFIDFVHNLISQNIPFTLAMLDLDNFKQINDNYGHQTGDEVLRGVASDLSKYLGSNGIVGRFGGDEFVYVDLVNIDYDSNHNFLSGMYNNFCVLRKNLKLSNCNPFITGTIGACTFPKDAKTYEDLLACADKTLYRGKVKGRNCYIIYVESKHKNITVQKIAKEDLYTVMYTISHEFESAITKNDKLYTLFINLESIMKIQYLLFIDKTGAIIDCNNGKIIGTTKNFKKILGDTAIIDSNYVYDTTSLDGMIHDELGMLPLQSILITRIEMNNHFFGHLLCTEQRNSRIWQPDEKALLFYVAKCLAGFFERESL